MEIRLVAEEKVYHYDAEPELIGHFNDGDEAGVVAKMNNRLRLHNNGGQ